MYYLRQLSNNQCSHPENYHPIYSLKKLWLLFVRSVFHPTTILLYIYVNLMNKREFDNKLNNYWPNTVQFLSLQEVQILKALVLGEEERGQSTYQVMCFVTRFLKTDFISSDAMAKLRQVSDISNDIRSSLKLHHSFSRKIQTPYAPLRKTGGRKTLRWPAGFISISLAPFLDTYLTYAQRHKTRPMSET